MRPSDRELIRSCLRGEQRAWTELISRYQRLIYSVARGLSPQIDDCSDIFQHVCLQLYQNLNQLRNEDMLPAWLITITRRTAYTAFKTRSHNVSLEEFEMDSAPRVEMIQREFALEAAVRDLPVRCRELIQMLYFDPTEPSYNEISVRLNIPVPSVGPTRARCLEKLRKRLT